jgi:glycerol kinase
MRETTALGAAIAAGLAVGMWRNFAELRDINRAGGAVFEPKITRQESSRQFATWEKAVKMCRGWVGETPLTDDNLTTNTAANQTSTTAIAAAAERISVPTSGATQPVNINKQQNQHKQPLVAETVVQELTPPHDDGMDYLSSGLLTNRAKMAPHHHHHHHQHRFGSLAADLADADEEDLVIELRKLEILQQLKKMKKVRATAYA